MRELLCWSLRFVCLFAGFTLSSAEPARAQQQDGKVLVTASLISDISSIQPGQKFRIGVLYRIEPGWHIYWKNPGDAGIPTKITWRLPEGFKVHDLQWPIPTREKEPGDLEVFAYSSEVLLFAEVEAPQSLPNGPIEIQAKSDWLVCENFCIPGSAQLSLKMNTGVNAPSQSAPIFEKYKGSFWTPASSPRSRILAGAAMLLVILVAIGAYAFVTQPSQLAWQQFSKDSLERALASGRPVFRRLYRRLVYCVQNERTTCDRQGQASTRILEAERGPVAGRLDER